MSQINVNAVRCEALFVSPLQPSDAPSAPVVREEIQRTVRNLGSRGCAARVAQEFGDHPEAAILRMRWAREAVGRAFLERVRPGGPFGSFALVRHLAGPAQLPAQVPAHETQRSA
jgi:hypothetical protein